MNKARETRERHTDKFHNSMSSLGFEPPNHGVAAIVANHWTNDNSCHLYLFNHCKRKFVPMYTAGESRLCEYRSWTDQIDRSDAPDLITDFFYPREAEEASRAMIKDMPVTRPPY